MRKSKLGDLLKLCDDVSKITVNIIKINKGKFMEVNYLSDINIFIIYRYYPLNKI